MSDKADPPAAPTLIAYRIHPYPSLPIVPASQQRQWMDQTSDRFAYRCLPLLIANQHGWLILNVHKIRAIWNGGDKPNAVTVMCKDGPRATPCPAESHFGHGVLTWSLNYLFRTPPGWNLWCRGPANAPKDGCVPLEGIIETDWSVATFTMNWKITAVGQPIDFEPGEPICMISPVKRGEVESFHPIVRDISTEPEVKAAFEKWSASRSQFLKDLVNPASKARAVKWQKDYVQGHGPGVVAEQHQVKLNLREFEIPKSPEAPKT